jgi:hypothetical protein
MADGLHADYFSAVHLHYRLVNLSIGQLCALAGYQPLVLRLTLFLDGLDDVGKECRQLALGPDSVLSAYHVVG